MCELCIVIETQACELWCLVPVRSMYPGSAMLVFLKACFYCCVFMVCVCVCLFACLCLFMAHMWSDSQRTAYEVSSLLSPFCGF